MIDLVGEYQKHLTVLNYASGTVRGNLFHLHRFLGFIREGGIHEISGVTKDVIQAYQMDLSERINHRGEPNSVASQNNALKAVRSFFRFLAKEGYLISDPARDISYARAPKRLPRSILTQSEAKKVLHAPDTKTVLGYRDRTLLEVLYSTAIRKEEAINLLLQDVDYREGFIRVNNGKGRKDRVVPVGRIACRYLENYVLAVRPSLIRDPHNDHLFLSLKGNRLSKNMAWDIVKKHAERAKIKRVVSPHTFRHTCATLMLRNKANIRHIQEMLGHASLDSTQVYTSVSITDLKEVHGKCHPRERDRE
jgi:integrase/recombinase XerD